MLKVCKNKFLYLLLPVVIILAGVVGYFVQGGFQQDIDFAGGTTMQFEMGRSLSDAERKTIEDTVKNAAGLEVAPRVQMTGAGFTSALVKTNKLSDEQIKTSVDALKAAFPAELESTTVENLTKTTIDSSYGKQMKTKTLAFSIIAALAMLVYIIFRFDWRSAIMAVASLTINVLCMISVYALFGIPLSTTFIAAILTIMGYSINDTIVVFDRIRENTKIMKNATNVEIADKSVKDSITRTINTSVTTLVTIVILYFMGATTLKEFALPIIIGVIVGTYTSIFIASPWSATWKDAAAEAKKKKALAKKTQKKSKKK